MSLWMSEVKQTRMGGSKKRVDAHASVVNDRGERDVGVGQMKQEQSEIENREPSCRGLQVVSILTTLLLPWLLNDAHLRSHSASNLSATWEACGMGSRCTA